MRGRHAIKLPRNHPPVRKRNTKRKKRLAFGKRKTIYTAYILTVETMNRFYAFMRLVNKLLKTLSLTHFYSNVIYAIFIETDITFLFKNKTVEKKSKTRHPFRFQFQLIIRLFCIWQTVNRFLSIAWRFIYI